MENGNQKTSPRNEKGIDQKYMGHITISKQDTSSPVKKKVDIKSSANRLGSALGTVGGAVGSVAGSVGGAVGSVAGTVGGAVKGEPKSHERLKVGQGDNNKTKHKIEFEIGLKVLSGFSDSANGQTLLMKWKESKLNKG